MTKTKKQRSWKDYNGPDKPITEEQIETLLAEYDIHPRIDAQGNKYWHRDDFEGAFAAVLFGKTQ
jgi:hypothetical protein